MATVDGINLHDGARNPEALRGIKTPNRLAALAKQIRPSWWKYLLVGTDALLILVAFALAYALRYRLQWFRAVDPASTVEFVRYAPFMFAYLVVVLSSFVLSDVYPYQQGRKRYRRDLPRSVRRQRSVP